MRLKVVQSTVLKLKPVQSSELPDTDKFPLEAGKELDLHSYLDDGNNHLRVAFQGIAFQGRNTWYVYSPHVQLLDDSGNPVTSRRQNAGTVAPAPAAAPSTATSANATSEGWSWPMKGTSCGEVCEFGYARGRLHAGVDIGGWTPDEVHAASDGVVKTVKNDTSGAEGRAIYINRPDGWQHVYYHLKSILVKEGQSVKRGEQIAVRGGSGWDSEDGYAIHLHFEVRKPDGTPVNPRDILPDDGSNPIVG